MGVMGGSGEKGPSSISLAGESSKAAGSKFKSCRFCRFRKSYTLRVEIYEIYFRKQLRLSSFGGDGGALLGGGGEGSHSSLFTVIFFTTLQGLPAAMQFEGISLTTTEPAPMVTLSPMVTPGRMVTLPPIHTLSPMVTGSAHSLRLLRSTGSVL